MGKGHASKSADSKLLSQEACPRSRQILIVTSVTRKKLPNVCKSCPKMILARKIKDFDNFTKIA